MTNHVPTLETCQRLKAAGFPQATEFIWFKWKDLPWQIDNRPHVKDGMRRGDGEWCAAPLLTEILEQLPFEHPIDDRYELLVYWEHGICNMEYQDRDRDVVLDFANHDNPAEAAALLWLELKENS